MAKKNTRQVRPSQTQTASSAASPSPERWIPWALAALVLLLYATGFGNQLVGMDDHTATVDNPAVREGLGKLFSHYNLGMYAPITWMCYSFCYALGKDSPFWYHLIGAIVHAANAMLAFQLFRRLNLDTVAAGTVAFCFAIHPMQVEAVSWIAAFSTPLYAFFALLSLNAFVLHMKQPEPGLGRSYWLALLFFLLAGLSKSTAASMPLVLLVFSLWLKRPLSFRNILEKAPFALGGLSFGILTLISRKHAGHLDVPMVYSIGDRVLMACHSILFYWTKLLFPFGLSIWYPFEKTAGGSWPWTYYVAPVVLIGVFFLAWRLWNRARFFGLGLLFYMANIVLMLPYATFGTFELRSDRYNYLACLGIFSILAALPAYFKAKKPAWAGAARVVLGAFALMWMVITLQRIRDWKNTLTLVDSAIATTGDNFGRAYLWRGMEYGDQGKAGPAIRDLTLALEKNPALIEAYKYRGGIYGLTKQYEKSVSDLNQYLAQNPEDAEIHYNRGLSLLNLGRLPEAIQDFDKTLEINPEFVRAYRARGNAYKNLGQVEKGEADLKEWEKRQQ